MSSLPRTSDDITVVIAAFNAASTLDAALASVAAQSEAPGAVVVADDASTDATAVIVERWADRLPVSVVRLGENGGPAVARHAAIEAVQTDLVALLDADDYWFPDHIESMLAAYRSRPGLVTADALPWIAGRTLANRSFGHEHPLPERDRLLPALIQRNFLFIGTLFERELYVTVGGFRSQFRGTEDWDLWIRMVRSGVSVNRPDHPTVLYRVSPAGLSARDEQIAADLAVVESGLREAESSEELRAMQSKAHQLGAQQSLADSYRAAREGRTLVARRHAVRALRGQRRVALRAVAMALAPRWGVHQRDLRGDQPRWRFRRI